jgi:uncharacterized membrane protein
VEFLGQPHCGACRDRRLRWLSPPARRWSYARVRETLLVVAAVLLGVSGFFLHSGVWPAAIGFGALLAAVLLAALAAHVMARGEQQ